MSDKRAAIIGAVAGFFIALGAFWASGEPFQRGPSGLAAYVISLCGAFGGGLVGMAIRAQFGGRE